MKKALFRRLIKMAEQPPAKSKKKTLRTIAPKLPTLRRADELIITDAAESRYLVEGQWLKVSFDKEIRIDRNTHMRTGEKHAHIYNRKGKQLYSLTHEGKPSHNSQRFKLDKDQADALRKAGFTIKPNRIVEGTLIGSMQMVIYG